MFLTSNKTNRSILHEAKARRILATSGLALASGLASAQSLSMPSRDVSVAIDSGVLVAPPSIHPSDVQRLFATDVHVPGARWLRLWFTNALLPGNSVADGAVLRLTSLADGATQHLDAQQLAWWSNSSAYFNGDAVRVELFARPSSGPARLEIQRVTVGESLPYADRSICGDSDDRVPSADPRVGRLITVGINDTCTAFLFDDPNRTFLTAGHCDPVPPKVVQFNVPLSTTTGAPRHPPPSDQYAIDASSVQTQNIINGADWAYFATLPNSETGLTAYQRQRAFFRLAPAAPLDAGGSARVTGYGFVPGTPDRRVFSVTQQTHVGSYSGVVQGEITLSDGTRVPLWTLRHQADTTSGQSGSAVEFEGDGHIAGIHTHGGCSPIGGFNEGTAIQQPDLQVALVSPRGACRSGIGAPMPFPSVVLGGDINNTFGTLNTSTGEFATTIGQDAGLVRFQGLAYDAFAGRVLALADQRLFLIDPGTGVVSPRAVITGSGETLASLAFEPSRRTLYAIAQASGQLYEVDSFTGSAMARGSPLGGRLSAFEYDRQRRAFFAIDNASPASLVRIDVSMPSRTPIGPLGSGLSECHALAIDADGVFYTVDAATRNLYAINPNTGAATLVGPTNALFSAALGMTAVTPRFGCFADVDQDGGLTIDDLFLFLDMFVRGDILADVDDGSSTATRDGGVTIDDLLYYLCRFQDGC